MRIVETLIDIETANPTAMTVLENIGDVPIFHENYKVRHPLAAYNISLDSVSQRILRVIDALEIIQTERKFENSKDQGWEVPLIEATDHMLDALMEHMEDCGGIIRSFFPNSKDIAFKKALKEFNVSVAPYRDHIGKIVNYMKHNQGRLRTVTFSWPSGSSIGYFVEGPLKNGGLGPVSVIHSNEATAFSFFRDIPFHLCNVYAVSRRLSAVLQSIDRRLKPAKKKTSTDKQSNLVNALRRASKLPYIYFEDEVKMGVPLIKFSNKAIKLDCPSEKVKAVQTPNGSNITVAFRGDGITRSYALPYYNSKS